VYLSQRWSRTSSRDTCRYIRHRMPVRGGIPETRRRGCPQIDRRTLAADKGPVGQLRTARNKSLAARCIYKRATTFPCATLSDRSNRGFCAGQSPYTFVPLDSGWRLKPLVRAAPGT
jgi:hypothetical protein